MKFKSSILLFGITLIIGCVLGIIIYMQISRNMVSKQNVSEQSTKHLVQTKSTTQNHQNPKEHMITIENVDNPDQLQEILKLLEKYSNDNKLSDIKVKYVMEKSLKDSITSPK